MSNFHTPIETANKEASLRIEGYQAALSYIPIIENVIREFDGKVYNCRLDNAIREATSNRVVCGKKYESLSIYTWPPNSYSYQIQLTYISFNQFKDNKRIPADKIIADMNSYREAHLKTIQAIERALLQMPQVKARIQNSIDKLNNYIQSIPFEVRDIYGIPYSVRLY